MLEYFWRFCNPEFKKWKSRKEVASFPCRSRKILWIYSWYSLPYFKHDQKRFIRIPSSNVPEMTEVFMHILVNFISRRVTMETMNFDFSFGSVFPSSMTVQSFITFKLQEKKLSMIKIFKFFVSDHRKQPKTLEVSSRGLDK